jgi:hypothetical protein
MRRRLPWALVLPLAFLGSWLAHVVGRSLSAAPVEGSEAAEHLERSGTVHAGAMTLGVAELVGPFAAIAAILLAARLWTRMRGRSWRGASPWWFSILPAVAYLSGESLERLLSGGSAALGIHAIHEPGVLLALALQVPFGAVACVVAFLLLAAARSIVAKVRGLRLADRQPRHVGAVRITRAAPTRWTCLVGAHGVRGPPIVLSS